LAKRASPGDIARARDTARLRSSHAFGAHDFAEGVNALADRRSPRFIGK